MLVVLVCNGRAYATVQCCVHLSVCCL